jgi:hypothetical protein
MPWRYRAGADAPGQVARAVSGGAGAGAAHVWYRAAAGHACGRAGALHARRRAQPAAPGAPVTPPPPGLRAYL